MIRDSLPERRAHLHKVGWCSSIWGLCEELHELAVCMERADEADATIEVGDRTSTRSLPYTLQRQPQHNVCLVVCHHQQMQASRVVPEQEARVVIPYSAPALKERRWKGAASGGSVAGGVVRDGNLRGDEDAASEARREGDDEGGASVEAHAAPAALQDVLTVDGDCVRLETAHMVAACFGTVLLSEELGCGGVCGHNTCSWPSPQLVRCKLDGLLADASSPSSRKPCILKLLRSLTFHQRRCLLRRVYIACSQDVALRVCFRGHACGYRVCIPDEPYARRPGAGPHLCTRLKVCTRFSPCATTREFSGTIYGVPT
jgi:hypothetical protein